jgi:large subunit ribosomal protein L31
MKKSGHPPYQEVVFEDSSTGQKFLCGTTLAPKEKTTFEGKEYPLCRVSVSSSSHPFFTGSSKLVDSEGRVDKFKKRYAAQDQQKKNAPEEKEKEKEKKKKK